MSGQQDVFYLEVDGLKRRYVLFRPDSVIEGGEQTPLVLMLDGRGGTPWTAMRSTLWNDKASREGFIMAYPEATRLDPDGPLHFLTNPQMWNAGAGGSDVERPVVDDLKFLRAVLDDAPIQARIDPLRCYMTGFSNGAAMTYRFALTYPETLRAIAPVAGHFRVADAVLDKPVPMISLFGKLDPLSPIDGGPVDLPWGNREIRPPAVDSVTAWAVLCGHQPESGVWTSPENGLRRLTYGAPGDDNEVEFWVVDDLGHTWPGGHRLLPEALVGPTSNTIIANDVIWSFFRRHSEVE